MKAGFVAIIGRPNVGKSTLLNHLIGQKISITSRKPQTTRHKVTGILTINEVQYVFVDTPGFQKRYLNPFNQALNQSVVNSLRNVDIIYYVVEAGVFTPADMEVLNLIGEIKPVFLVINKSDKVKNKLELSTFVNNITTQYKFSGVYKVSAKHALGLSELLNETKVYLPESEFLYPKDSLTDKSSKFLASEIIREKLFRSLGAELPYNLMVEIERFEEEAAIYRIYASIIVDKDNQKPMVIGKNGDKLKKIATEARLDMEKLFGIKVYLELWVKVKSGFAAQIQFLKQFE